jgi:hypothetical protein
MICLVVLVPLMSSSIRVVTSIVIVIAIAIAIAHRSKELFASLNSK